MTDLSAKLTIHFGDGHVSADVSFAFGKAEIDSPQDVLIKDVVHEGASIIEQVAQPEIQAAQQRIYDQFCFKRNQP